MPKAETTPHRRYTRHAGDTHDTESLLQCQNEPCNVQKNCGYAFGHTYGHGQQTLPMVFGLLNVLAFVAHVL